MGKCYSKYWTPWRLSIHTWKEKPELLSDIALTNISEMLFNIMALFLLLLLSSLQAGHFHWIAGQ